MELRAGPGGRWGAALGVALVVAHAGAFTALVPRCQGAELAVTITGALAADPESAGTLRGTVPAALAPRVTISQEGAGPGLVRTRWGVRYRGGFERSVGAAQLVGPFQDPAARTCTGRVVVGQRLLDDGAAGAGTVAGQLRVALTSELRGLEVFPLGSFTRVSGVALRWARLDAHPEDRGFVGAAPHGYVRAALTVELTRGAVPLVIALVPAVRTPDGRDAPDRATLIGGEDEAPRLRFRIAVRARIAVGNRVAQWLSDHLGGNALASTLARRELESLLVTTLAPPPPFEVPGGPALRFTYCDDPPAIEEGVAGALPFAVELGRVPGAPAILPPRQGPGPRPPLAPGTALALDLDLDALNALLHELWRGGALDRQLAAAGLDRRFNTDPTVTSFLSVRISPVRLALPPVLTATPIGLRLAADARVTIADRALTTTGRLWGTLALTFGTGGTALSPEVALDALALSCERRADVLVPCYGDLVGAVRTRGADVQGALTAALAGVLTNLFVDRHLAADGLPAEVVITRATPRLTPGASTASLRLDLDATIVPTR